MPRVTVSRHMWLQEGCTTRCLAGPLAFGSARAQPVLPSLALAVLKGQRRVSKRATGRTSRAATTAKAIAPRISIG